MIDPNQQALREFFNEITKDNPDKETLKSLRVEVATVDGKTTFTVTRPGLFSGVKNALLGAPSNDDPGLLVDQIQQMVNRVKRPDESTVRLVDDLNSVLAVMHGSTKPLALPSASEPVERNNKSLPELFANVSFNYLFSRWSGCNFSELIGQSRVSVDRALNRLEQNFSEELSKLVKKPGVVGSLLGQKPNRYGTEGSYATKLLDDMQDKFHECKESLHLSKELKDLDASKAVLTMGYLLRCADCLLDAQKPIDAHDPLETTSSNKVVEAALIAQRIVDEVYDAFDMFADADLLNDQETLFLKEFMEAAAKLTQFKRTPNLWNIGSLQQNGAEVSTILHEMRHIAERYKNTDFYKDLRLEEFVTLVDSLPL